VILGSHGLSFTFSSLLQAPAGAEPAADVSPAGPAGLGPYIVDGKQWKVEVCLDNYFVMLNEKEKFPHHNVITYEALGKLAPDGSSVMIVCTDSTILKYKKGSAYAVGFAVGSSPVMASVLILQFTNSKLNGIDINAVVPQPNALLAPAHIAKSAKILMEQRGAAGGARNHDAAPPPFHSRTARNLNLHLHLNHKWPRRNGSNLQPKHPLLLKRHRRHASRSPASSRKARTRATSRSLQWHAKKVAVIVVIIGVITTTMLLATTTTRRRSSSCLSIRSTKCGRHASTWRERRKLKPKPTKTPPSRPAPSSTLTCPDGDQQTMAMAKIFDCLSSLTKELAEIKSVQAQNTVVFPAKEEPDEEQGKKKKKRKSSGSPRLTKVYNFY